MHLEKSFFLDPLVDLCIRHCIRPNHVTVGSLGLRLISFVLWWSSGKPLLLPFVFAFLGELGDHLDGHLARKTNQVTLYGKWLDMGCDLINGLLLSMTCYLKSRKSPGIVGATALVGSAIVLHQTKICETSLGRFLAENSYITTLLPILLMHFLKIYLICKSTHDTR